MFLTKFWNFIGNFKGFQFGFFSARHSVFTCYKGQCPAAICLDLEHEGASLRHNQQGSRTVCSQPIPDN